MNIFMLNLYCIIIGLGNIVQDVGAGVSDKHFNKKYSCLQTVYLYAQKW